MAEPKVYGMLVWAPRHWDVETAPNGNRQVRAVAAVNSKAEFGRLLREHRVPGASAYHVNQQACQTGNGEEVEKASAQPGVLFRYGGVNDRRGTLGPAESVDDWRQA